MFLRARSASGGRDVSRTETLAIAAQCGAPRRPGTTCPARVGTHHSRHRGPDRRRPGCGRRFPGVLGGLGYRLRRGARARVRPHLPATPADKQGGDRRQENPGHADAFPGADLNRRRPGGLRDQRRGDFTL